MSDTSILPGAGPSTESDVDMVPPGTGVDEAEGGEDRRRVLIIGAIAGAIVLVVAAYMLLHGGGSSSSTQSFVPVHSANTAPSAGPSPNQGPNGNAGKTPTLPKKAKHQSVRDPFKALVTAPVTTDTGPTTTTTVKAPKTVPTVAPSAPTASVAPTTPVSPVSPPPSGTSNPPTTGAGPQWIQLKRIHGRIAVLDVGYRHHKFRRYAVQAPPSGSQQGTVFDKIFALIGIQNNAATIQIGDDTPFDLNTGVSHVV